MKKQYYTKHNKIILLFLRYVFLVLISLNSLYVFYFVLTPITVAVAFFILANIFPHLAVSLSDNSVILLSGYSIEIVEACVAGAAYYLLFILNFTTPIKNTGKRIYALLFSLITFFIINIARIVFFSFLLVKGFNYFDQLHLFFWYVLSILFVAGIWVATIKLFKIKEIPVYSDLKYLKNLHKTKTSS